MNWKDRKKIFFSKLHSGNFNQLWFLIFRRIRINFLMKPIGIPISVIAVILIYAIRPFRRINLYSIPSGRLGHLLLQPEFYLRKKKSSPGSIRTLDIFFTSRAMNSGVIANSQVLKMLKRKLIIFDSYFSSWIYYSAEWILLRTKIICELPHVETVEAESLYKTVDSSYKFTEDEVAFGNSKLKAMGIEPNKDWFVIIFARDSAYLDKTYPLHDWGYHDWRNADINSYIEAVKFVINRGGYVIRMGSEVKRDLNFSNKRYIDYSKDYRSDFMDVFLVSRCKFLLGTNSGFSDLAVAFDKPRAIVNAIPLGHIPYGRNDIYIPKKFLDTQNSTYKTLSSALLNSEDLMFDQESFLKNKYTCVDNTPREILEITKEMICKLDNNFSMTSNQEKLLDDYFSLFNAYNSGYAIRNPIGINFLEKNESWIFDR